MKTLKFVSDMNSNRSTQFNLRQLKDRKREGERRKEKKKREKEDFEKKRARAEESIHTQANKHQPAEGQLCKGETMSSL